MTPTAADVMNHVQNHFPLMSREGAWRVSASVLEGPLPLHAGAWIAITRSEGFNGVYRADESARLPLPDAAFTARITLLAPPSDFLSLCDEIAAWCAANPRQAPKQGAHAGFSRTDGRCWEKEFGARLRPWRRMFNDLS